MINYKNKNLVKLMDINKFLEQTEGKWFSQRTTYNLLEKENPVENSKADLIIEILAPDNPQIINFCQQNALNSNLILSGYVSSWDNSVDWGKPKHQGSSMLILEKDENNEQSGKIFRVINKPEKKVIIGSYILGNDEALTLILQQDNYYIEERIWFASPNLRLRTTLTKNENNCTITSFYSEIKKIIKE